MKAKEENLDERDRTKIRSRILYYNCRNRCRSTTMTVMSSRLPLLRARATSSLHGPTAAEDDDAAAETASTASWPGAGLPCSKGIQLNTHYLWQNVLYM